MKSVSVKRFVKQLVEEISIDAYVNRGHHLRFPLMRAVMYCSFSVIRHAWCGMRGHQWKDFSHAGPEGGDVYLVCSRCGETHQRILY